MLIGNEVTFCLLSEDKLFLEKGEPLMNVWHLGDHKSFCREIVLFEVPPSLLALIKPAANLLNMVAILFACSFPVLGAAAEVLVYFLQRETLCTACLYLFNPINCQWKNGESLPYLFMCVVRTVTIDFHPSSADLVQGLKS